MDDERAAKFALHAVNLFIGEAHLQAEVVQVHLVRHGLRVDGHFLHLRYGGRVRNVHLEAGGDEDGLLNLFGAGDGRA